MNSQSISSKAEDIRDVLRYIKKFKAASVVIYIDDRLLEHPLFTSHIRDIAMIHEAGIQVVIVPGSRKRIDEVLETNLIPWKMKNGVRLTKEESLPLIKMAAFDVANRIMTSLAGEGKTAVIGNWVRARSMGILDGIDFSAAGDIDKIQTDAVKTILEDRFIPIFPCIGWSLAGKPYNISSVELAAEIAQRLQADKLFFLLPDGNIDEKDFFIPQHISRSPENKIPALNISEAQELVDRNTHQENISSTQDEILSKKEKILQLIRLGIRACTNGVSRVHILDGLIDGTIPCEIFSNLGCGTMIYESDYGQIREMTIEDIPAILNLIRPFVEEGILLPRTEQSLASTFTDYIVYELDDGIKGSAALHFYNDFQAEIAAVAVDPVCSHLGIGPKMMEYLLNKAQSQQAKSVFILTTRTADWFEMQGFIPDDISTLPTKRKEKWSPSRGSKLFRKKL
ncbi:MAG: amino-acid N-acetyltransferase [Treponema sp.]|nr:amino-acid N-acetyltransferase [Treponema sp.]